MNFFPMLQKKICKFSAIGSVQHPTYVHSMMLVETDVVPIKNVLSKMNCLVVGVFVMHHILYFAFLAAFTVPCKRPCKFGSKSERCVRHFHCPVCHQVFVRAYTFTRHMNGRIDSIFHICIFFTCKQYPCSSVITIS